MTDETFGQIIAVFSETYAMEFSAERLKTWRMLLDPLDDEAARTAAVTLCRSSPYPPKPADLFRLVHGTPEDAERLLDEEAEIAAAAVEQHLSDSAENRFGLALNASLRAMGGVDVVAALMQRPDWRFERVRLKTLYKAFVRRGASAAEGAPLIPQAVAASLRFNEEQRIVLPLVCPFVPALAKRDEALQKALPGGRPSPPDGGRPPDLPPEEAVNLRRVGEMARGVAARRVMPP